MQDFGSRYAEAWCTREPRRIAECFAQDGRISVNGGPAHVGHDAIATMAAGFFAAFPDIIVLCDDFRSAGAHALLAWTLEGHHAETKNFVRIGGWEDWELAGDGRIAASNGWFDAKDYELQIAGR